MATIKSFSDLQQSKKLAEILPLETADMNYCNMCIKGVMYADSFKAGLSSYKDAFKMNQENIDFFLNGTNYTGIIAWEVLPCWSLAALLNLLPNEIITDNRFECHYQIDIRKYDGGDNTTLYQIAYGNNRGSSGSWHDMINTGEKESLIDCCVQMITKLKEMNLI